MWAEQLDKPDAEALVSAIRILRDQGPTLGRPLIDTVKGSRHNNMKELRPGSTGRTESESSSPSTSNVRRSSSSVATRATTGRDGTRPTSRSPTIGSTITRAELTTKREKKTTSAATKTSKKSKGKRR